MSEHLHPTYIDWCFRCQISREESDAIQAEIQDRRERFDHAGLMRDLRAIGGDLEAPDDGITASFVADELFDSRWFARLVGYRVIESQEQK